MNCELQLDKSSGVYQPGETISGHIYLTLQTRDLIKAISLEANGYASVSWQKAHKEHKKKDESKQKPPLEYETRSDYLATVHYFVGSEKAVPKLMDEGIYHYPFRVQLPEHCPSSYESAHGQIVYELKIKVYTTSEAKLVHNRKVQLVQRLELQPDDLTIPYDTQRLEVINKMKFWRRPLQLEINIPRRGYIPKDGISVYVKLQNPQQLQLSEVIYKLNSVVTYAAQQKDKPKRRDVKVDRRSILNSVHQINDKCREEFFQHLCTLQVPQITPTLSSTDCSCLQISYEIEVIVKTIKRKRFICAQVPLVIGTGVEQMTMLDTTPALIADSAAPLTAARSMDELSTIGLASFPTAPLPSPMPTPLPRSSFSASMSSLASSFREADFMKATNLNKTSKNTLSGDNLDYKPRYLYYKMEHAEAEKML